MSIIDDLIFDRSEANLTAGDPKGKYDYEDYNRVGQAVSYVATEMNNGGYSIVVNPKTNWVNGDVPRQSQMTTYRNNVQTIIDALELGNSLPTTNKNILTPLGANQIEKALFDAHTIFNQIMQWNDVDDLHETWEELDSKNIKWRSYFLR
jgi:hypothetical protein